VIGCDGSECREGPLDLQAVTQEHHIFEFSGFREVERT